MRFSVEHVPVPPGQRLTEFQIERAVRSGFPGGVDYQAEPDDADQREYDSAISRKGTLDGLLDLFKAIILCSYRQFSSPPSA